MPQEEAETRAGVAQGLDACLAWVSLSLHDPDSSLVRGTVFHSFSNVICSSSDGCQGPGHCQLEEAESGVREENGMAGFSARMLRQCRQKHPCSEQFSRAHLPISGQRGRCSDGGPVHMRASGHHLKGLTLQEASGAGNCRVAWRGMCLGTGVSVTGGNCGEVRNSTFLVLIINVNVISACLSRVYIALQKYPLHQFRIRRFLPKRRHRPDGK